MLLTYKKGLKDSIPIALGYLSVSFGFGVIALNKGLTVLESVVMSITNVTSAGQLAGVSVIAAGGVIVELILTQLIINLRYALMSLSLSQKLNGNYGFLKRLITSFAVTDEVFAVAMSQKGKLPFKYMLGLQLLPILGWTLGTFLGASVCDLLPRSLSVALGVALYGMFIAIVIPVARESKSVATGAGIALVISTLFYYVPLFSRISSGIAIIISTVIAAAIAAWLFPVDDEREEE